MLASVIWQSDLTPEQFSFWLKIMAVAIPASSLLLLLPRCRHEWEEVDLRYGVGPVRCRRCGKGGMGRITANPDGSSNGEIRVQNER